MVTHPSRTPRMHCNMFTSSASPHHLFHLSLHYILFFPFTAVDEESEEAKIWRPNWISYCYIQIMFKEMHSFSVEALSTSPNLTEKTDTWAKPKHQKTKTLRRMFGFDSKDCFFWFSPSFFGFLWFEKPKTKNVFLFFA